MPQTPFRELFTRFYGALETLKIDYLAYGGVAVAVWGDPRETQDVAAVVALADPDIDSLLRSLAAAGFACSSEEARTFPIDGWLRLKFTGRHADLALGRTPFDHSALQRRRRRTLFGKEIWIASAEDLVLYKLLAYRYRDLADAETVLIRQQGNVDVTYLRKWAAEIAAHTAKHEVPQKLEELLERTSAV